MAWGTGVVPSERACGRHRPPTRSVTSTRTSVFGDSRHAARQNRGKTERLGLACGRNVERVSQMTEVPFLRFTSRLSPCYIPPGVLKIRGKSSVADRIGSFAERTPRGFFHGGRNQVLEFSYADSLSEIFEKGQSCPRVFFRTLFAER